MHNGEKMTYKAIFIYIFKTADNNPVHALTHRGENESKGFASGIQSFFSSIKIGKMFFGVPSTRPMYKRT